ncbi:MAG: phosphotransferase [Oligoflexia bacterium]|nr:phosphotransferase [Oligoflexia bacterium]
MIQPLETEKVIVFKDLSIGTTLSIEQSALEQIGEMIAHGKPTPSQVLGGRRGVVFGRLDQIGSVVLKHYGRGGLLGKFLDSHFFRLGTSRCAQEFRLLGRLHQLGVPVPEPIAYVTRGGFWYEAWLLTREIEGHRSLVQIATAEPDRIYALLDEVVAAVKRLIQGRVFHVDLHPGNVLVGHEGQIFLIDFDKACVFGGSRNALRDMYLRRWRRAVLKHRLPEVLAETFSAGLRHHFEED